VISEVDDVERCERERVERVDADVGADRCRRAPHPCVPEVEAPLDLNTSASGVYSWLSNHGRAYAFRRTVPSERWHWEH